MSARHSLPATSGPRPSSDRPSLIACPVDYGENMKLTARLGEVICRS